MRPDCPAPLHLQRSLHDLTFSCDGLTLRLESHAAGFQQLARLIWLLAGWLSALTVQNSVTQRQAHASSGTLAHSMHRTI